MAFDRYSNYLTWGGSIGSTGGEEWQCGLRLAIPDTNIPVPSLPDGAQMTALAAAINDFHSGPMLISSGARLEWVKVAPLNTAGEYTGDPVVYEYAAPIPGGGAGNSAAGPQASVVVTLFSGSSFGRANFGRFYTPWNTATVQASDGLIVASLVTEMANAAAGFIADVNALVATWAGANDQAVVIMSSEGAGTTKTPAEVRVGNVKDTQRRRRNRIPETYTVGVA